MELLLHQWGDWPELYRNTDKTEATEIVIIDSQVNYRGKLDTYLRIKFPCHHFVVGLWMLNHGAKSLQESMEQFILSPGWGGKGTRFVREQSDLRIV